MTLDALEDNLKTAYYGVIKESKDMNPNCGGYALPSLCYSVLPICRTPDETNHLYFRNLAIAREYEQSQKLRKKASTSQPFTVTFSSSTTISTETAPVIMTTNEVMTELNVTTTATSSASTVSQTTTATTLSTIPSTVQTIPTTKVIKRMHKKKNNNAKINKMDLAKHYITESPEIYIQPAIPSKIVDLAGKSYEKTQEIRKKRSFNNKKLGNPASIVTYETIKKNYPPTRNTENLKRICRGECELLENELCQKEYAIAKRHPAIGQILPLEDCFNLPEGNVECSSLGIAIDVDENEQCYWEDGGSYRGTVAVSQSGKPCLTWLLMMKEIADYPELVGQNYCR